MKHLCYMLLLLTASCQNLERDQIYTGKYVWGPEVDSFTPCDSEHSYWVSYDWAGPGMHEFYKNNSKIPYQPMYLKFRDRLLDEKVGGFGLDYDGLIRVSEVRALSFDLPASCQ